MTNDRPTGPGPAPRHAPGAAGGRSEVPGTTDAQDASGTAGGVLVVGYGNALRSDDGVGWHAAGLLARDPRLALADVRAAVQLTPELAADFGEVSLVVLVDATVEAGPGEIAVRPLAPAAATASAEAGARDTGGGAAGATSHHVGVEELLTLAGELYGAVPAVVIVSVGVATMEAGDELSPVVAAALPGVVDAVAAEVARHHGLPG